VDDLFITSDAEGVLSDIAAALKLEYGAVDSRTELQHDFLGIHRDFITPGEATLSMKGYINDILKKYTDVKRSKTPATDNLFIINNSSPILSKLRREEFHSAIMTLHYLAKRTRADILTLSSTTAISSAATTSISSP
jgi:hypothetical protein